MPPPRRQSSRTTAIVRQGFRLRRAAWRMPRQALSDLSVHDARFRQFHVGQYDGGSTAAASSHRRSLPQLSGVAEDEGATIVTSSSTSLGSAILQTLKRLF